MPKITGKLRREYNDVLQGMVKSIESLPLPAARAVAPVLAEAQRQIERDLKKWLAKMDGAERFTTQKLRMALVQVRQGLDTLKKTRPALLNGLNTVASDAAGLAVKDVENQVLRFSHMYNSELRPVNIDTAVTLARGNKLVLSRFEKSAKRYSGAIGARMIQSMAISRVKGDTIYDMGKRLEAELPTLFRGFRNRAAMVARTESMNAYNVHHKEAVKELVKDDPGMQMRWDASYDARRCIVCGGLDGKTVEVDKAFKLKWQLSSGTAKSGEWGHPPAHPNCRCILVAWHKDWEMEPEEKPIPHKVTPGSGRVLPPDPEKRNPPPKPKTPKVPKPKAPPRIPKTPKLPPSKPPPKPKIKPPPKLRKPRKPKEKPKAKWSLVAPPHGKRVWSKSSGEEHKVSRREVGGKLQFAAIPSGGGVATWYDGSSITAVRAFWGRFTALKSKAKKPLKSKAKKPDSEGSLPEIRKPTSKRKLNQPALTNALSDVDNKTPTKRGAEKFEDSGRMVRKQMKTLTVDEFGLSDADVGRSQVYAVGKMDASTAGYHHGDNIVLSKASHDRAVGFTRNVRAGASVTKHEAHGMKTLIHEQVHATGPSIGTSYRGAGLIIEEVTTEVNARRILREKFGDVRVKRSIATIGELMGGRNNELTGSYQSYIDKVHGAIKTATGVGEDEAWKLLEDASTIFKQGGGVITSVGKTVDRFVDSIPASLTSGQKREIGKLIKVKGHR